MSGQDAQQYALSGGEASEEALELPEHIDYVARVRAGDGGQVVEFSRPLMAISEADLVDLVAWLWQLPSAPEAPVRLPTGWSFRASQSHGAGLWAWQLREGRDVRAAGQAETLEVARKLARQSLCELVPGLTAR